MDILVLTPQLPHPPRQGASLRNYHILRGVAERHPLTLLSFVEQQPADPGPLLALCRQIETVPVPTRAVRQRLWQLVASGRPDMAHRLHSPSFESALRRLLRQHYDIVQVEGLELASATTTIREASPNSRIVFDAHNAEAELQRRALWTDLQHLGRWPAALYSWVQVGRLRRFEAWACGAADHVTCVSETDRQALGRLVPGLPATVIPNCLDVAAYRPPGDLISDNLPHYDVVFSGKMDYRPNIDAVLWFADDIWPRVRRLRPQTTWAIVGQNPHARLNRLRSLEGVTITGAVERVQPYFWGAGVVVVPLRLGSGTRLKLIEAMAAGKAIVSTPIGAEGFAVQDGVHLALAETAEAFAQSILRLLASAAERERIGKAAQVLAQAYDWRNVIPRFEEVYSSRL